MMKNRSMKTTAAESRLKKAAVFMSMTIISAALSGCGNSDKGDVPTVEIVHTDTPEWEAVDEKTADGNEENAESKMQSGGQTAERQEPAAAGENTGADQSGEGIQASETIIGNVRSISDDTVVISRVFEESSDGAEVDILVAPAEGSADEVLVTVYLSENTKYEVHTVKNGGVNGADDVESREGTPADLKEGATVDVVGSFEGEGFAAEKIVVYFFV